MTDRPDQRARLLAETFHEDWAAGPAAAFARAAAGRARARRRLRTTASAAGVAALLAVFAFVLNPSRAPAPLAAPRVAANRAEPAPPASVKHPEPASTARGYEIISDEQLLAQLRDRPLLVVQRPNGSRQITLLENE